MGFWIVNLMNKELLLVSHITSVTLPPGPVTSLLIPVKVKWKMIGIMKRELKHEERFILFHSF